MKTEFVGVKGFARDNVEALEAAGWIRGTECGYKMHAGFVKDTAVEGRHLSLTPSRRPGRYTLATIVRGIAEYSTVVTVEEACQR